MEPISVKYLNAWIGRTAQSGIIMMLDFEEGFATVKWSFLFKTLEKFNFGPQFFKWVKTIVPNPCALSKNNDWVSDKVAINRGIRPGYPVLVLLFIYLQILAIKLKQSP